MVIDELSGCYTEQERKEIEAGARAYDDMCKAELEEERRVREKQKPQTPIEYLEDLYRECENIELDYIRTLTASIGLLTAIREKETDPAKQRRLNSLINHETMMIELKRREIVDDRNTIAGFKEIYGNRSSHIRTGNDATTR